MYHRIYVSSSYTYKKQQTHENITNTDEKQIQKLTFGLHREKNTKLLNHT